MRTGPAILFAMVTLSATPALAGERFAFGPPERSCARYGPGFTAMPGSSTCIRIGGRIRAQYGTATRRVSRNDIAGFGTSASVSVDSRTDTAYGPVRTFVRLRAGQPTGPSR